MAVITEYGIGVYRPAEAHVLFRERMMRPGLAKGVIHCHGQGGTALSYLQATFRPVPHDQTDAGFFGLAADLGGLSTWGNDAGDAAMDDADAYLDNFTLPASKVVLVGGSMGSLTACWWALNNPTRVSALVLLIPVVDLVDAHDNQSYGAEIEAAYGSEAAYLAAVPNRSPVERVADLDAFPVHIWYSTDDPECPAALTTAFGAAVGAQVHSLGAVGHSTTGLPVADVTAAVRAA